MPDDRKSLAEVGSELWELLISYGKQETVEPLKGLQRFVAYGVAGALLTGVGLLLLTLAGLRALQTQTDGHLSGNLSWIPYVAAMVLLGALIGVCIRMIKGSSR